MYRSHVMVCGGTGCTSSGSDKIAKAFEDEILATGLENEVKVIRTGCFGLCALGPIVVIYPEGSFYSMVKEENVKEIVDEHLLKGRPVTRLLYDETVAEDNTIKSLDETAFYKKQLRIALRDKSYWCLHAGFFTCGFHIAFLVTHMPGEVDLCGLSASVASTSLAIIGLSNVVGSLVVGALGERMRMKMILFWMYASRAVAIVIFMLAPKTPATFYLFAIALGATWLATVPPTAGITAKLFGTRYLATLFGLTLLSHQIGGFLGAWLGGIAVVATGNYDWMWWADAALALLAALVNLPIKEERPKALVADNLKAA